jgi:hypothetical protein
MTTVFFKKQEAQLVKIRPAQDQTYFDNFNWNNVTAGDIIWLEDYTAEDGRPTICGIVTMFNFNNPIIRLIPAASARYLAKHDCQSIDDLKGCNLFSHFHNFMYE